WRPLLDALGPTEDEELRHQLEIMLATFSASPVRGELAQERGCFRSVEFLMDCPAEEGLFPERVTVRGVIDCLWEDGEGGRRLLGFVLGERKRRSAEWPLGLLLAAWAVERQTGARPRTVACYDFVNGAIQRIDGGQLPCDKALAAVAAAVSGLRRE